MGKEPTCTLNFLSEKKLLQEPGSEFLPETSEISADHPSPSKIRYFTLPQKLSSTTASKGYTTFTALTNVSNLTAELDSAAGLTALIPTNSAFTVANVSSTNPTTPSLMDAHIIPNFVGYLPALTDGLKLITQAGTTITVTVKGNDIYLNNAKIIASNLILENGVAHVLDKVRLEKFI